MNQSAGSLSLRVDLHSHSTASDGSLAPQELLERAAGQGVSLFSITDHDTVGAYEQLSVPQGMQLLPGVELSCVWSGVTVHVVGLDVALDSSPLGAALMQQDDARRQRAQVIGERLAKRGFDGAYKGALALAGNRAVGRPDFAQFLVSAGHVQSVNEAFDRYLGAGKIGDVKAMWPALATVVQWIREAGGVAVLAHPLHYKLTATKLRALIADFAAADGEAMEVSNGRPSNDELSYARRLCQQFGLEASVGSDFHRPTPWNELGCDVKLAGECPPVWRRWLKP